MRLLLSHPSSADANAARSADVSAARSADVSAARASDRKADVQRAVSLFTHDFIDSRMQFKHGEYAGQSVYKTTDH